MDFPVSVVLPTFNRAGLLTRALDSVLSQSHMPEEIIVVDDGSTDQTATILRRQYPAVIYLAQENRGVSSARNLGVARSSGEWIAFLDSDDEWLPRKLETQIRALARNTRYQLCHTDEIWIRNGVRVNPMQKHEKSGGWIFEKCLPRCVISPSSVLLSRALFDATGGFDEDLPACEDYDLWLRICACHPVLFLRDPLIRKYGGHSDQLSRCHWGMDRFRVCALEKIIASGNLSERQKTEAIEVLIEKCEILANGATKRGSPGRAGTYREKIVQYRGQVGQPA